MSEDFYFSYPARVEDIKQLDSLTAYLLIEYYPRLYLNEVGPQYEILVSIEDSLFKQVCRLKKGDIVWAEAANNHQITKVIHLKKWKRFFSRWFQFKH